MQSLVVKYKNFDLKTYFQARTSLEKLKADFKTTAVYYPNIGN